MQNHTTKFVETIIEAHQIDSNYIEHSQTTFSAVLAMFKRFKQHKPEMIELDDFISETESALQYLKTLYV